MKDVKVQIQIEKLFIEKRRRFQPNLLKGSLRFPRFFTSTFHKYSMDTSHNTKNIYHSEYNIISTSKDKKKTTKQ